MTASNLDFVLTFIAIPFYIVGLIGNILVIRIVHKTREMHTPTNYLLVNLAVSDVTIIVLGPLQFSSTLYRNLDSAPGEFVCKVAVLIAISTVSSALTLTVLAVERYHALLKPFQTRLRLREENAKQAIAIIWILSIVLCSPQFVFEEWSEFHLTCVGPWTLYMNKASKIYLIIMSVFVTYIPMVIMFYCYGSLIRGIYSTNTICPDTTGDRRSEKEKLAITFILVTAGFFVCYTPSVVFYYVVAFKYNENKDWTLYNDLSLVFDNVFALSLSLNPIFYAFRSTSFKEGFKRIIFCRTPETQNNDNQSI